MRLRRAIWLFLPLGWVLACGGRFEKTVEGGDDQAEGGSTSAAGATSSSGGSRAGKAGSSSRAGSSSKGGGSSRGGTTSHAGAASVGGTTSVAGSFGTAASGGICICAEPSCAPPFRAVPNADGCCDHCELDLMQCAADEQAYQTYQVQVIQKYQTLGCMSDGDCGLFVDKNACGGGCGASMLNSQIMVVRQMLDAYAQATCSSACPPPPVPYCPASSGPKCVLSHCQ